MNGFLDGFLVGLLLIAGFGYAIYALGPKSLRVRLLTGAAALFGGLPVPVVRPLAARLAAAAGRAGAVCGGCGTCGSTDAAVSGRGAGGSAQESRHGMPDGVSEVRVPLSKIGRRR